MPSTTRWKDTTNKSFDDIRSILNNVNTAILYDRGYSDLESKNFYKNSNSIAISGKDIKYNFYEYSVQKKMDADSSDDVRVIKFFILLYEKDSHIYYIIDKNTDAKPFIRGLMSYSGQREIEQIDSKIDKNMLIWLISRVYTLQNEIEDEEFIINSVISFRGSTDDQLTSITADGDSITNLLSTLTFILESKTLKYIKVRIDYKTHKNLEIKLAAGGVVSVNTDNYIGPFLGSSDLMAKVLLVVYLEILPLIRDWYNSNGGLESNYYTDFYKKLADDVSDKIHNMNM